MTNHWMRSFTLAATAIFIASSTLAPAQEIESSPLPELDLDQFDLEMEQPGEATGDGTAGDDGGTVVPAGERIENPVAEFTGIDKITGRIITFDVYVDETVQFGALQVTPRVCYASPETEEPRTDSFVQVDEITLDRKIRRIFSGWMFAESPGINAVEHAVYDVWLKDCKQESDVPPPDTASN